MFGNCITPSLPPTLLQHAPSSPLPTHSIRWAYKVSNGDVVEMFGDCQERLQHAVKVERRAEDAGPRISLVFKERLRTPGGGYAGM